MKNFLLILCTIAMIGISSCTITTDDGVFSDDVVGTYAITTIESNLAGYSTLGGSVIVTEVNDETVDLLIDFESSSVTDLTVNGVALSSGANDDIDLDKTFSNAVGLGFVNGDDLRFKIDYDGDNYIDITAAK